MLYPFIIIVLAALVATLAVGLYSARQEILDLEDILLQHESRMTRSFRCVTCKMETKYPTPTTHGPVCPVCYAELKELF